MQQQQCCSGTKTGGSTSGGGKHGENQGMQDLKSSVNANTTKYNISGVLNSSEYL